jgi:UDP-2,3-diacylglucosamine pyrophosphatase LpxH
MHGLKALKNRQLLNTLYKHVRSLKEHSVSSTYDLIELLLKYGDNVMTVDYYYSYLVCAF